ncbi:type VI secretion lipoprotein TssJ [Campylobacter jejuni]|nr:type VI secretion lipoprotein TssJ [Campylobacter jejuni]
MYINLRILKKFEEASDIDLATREEGVLGKDKLDSIKTQIAPKDNIIAVKVDEEEVPYVGILVLFANNTKKTTKNMGKDRRCKWVWEE